LFTDAGIAIVGTNYRMLHAASREKVFPPVQACLDDIKYALQYVRYHADEWDLDPNVVGLTGVSAGAFSALWLGLSDDMADPDADDPVLRESTRVSAIGVRDAQTSIDPIQMREWVGPELRYGGHAFGLNEKDFEGFLKQRSKFEKYFSKMSPAALISRDDPAIFLFYKFSPDEENKGGNFYVHSPDFGIGFKELADRNRVECYVQYPGKSVPGYDNRFDFVLKQLKKGPSPDFVGR
jgi:acetyl esterase/lipase